MNVFSLFTLEKDSKKALSIENIKNFFMFVKDVITALVDKNEMTGLEKKQELDQSAIDWVKNNWFGYNSSLDWILDKLFIPFIPTINQIAYDFLKERIQNLTK